MQNKPSPFLKTLRTVAATFAPPLLVFALAGIAPSDMKYADLASHFMGQYALSAIILLIAAGFGRAHVSVFAALLLTLLMSLYQLRPFLPLESSVVTRGQTLKILQVNVLYINKDTDRLRKFILTERPDVIVVSEATSRFKKMLAAMKKEYPWQDIHPDDDGPRGIGVASRVKLESVALTSFDHPSVPAQIFTLMHAGRKVTFVSVHPYTPIQAIKRRDNELKLIAERFTQKPVQDLILIGDFNATPYCYAYKKLVHALGLRNAREGYGIYPSWPAFNRTPLARIPIDHTLVSAGIAVADYRTGPHIGSDHMPTITEIAVR